MGPDGKGLPVPNDLPNAHMRLFGGAQYHRAMAEFRLGMAELVCPDISREEIVNACGIDDFHDGVNYTRTACVIAVSKARDIFEPFLHQVGRYCFLCTGRIRLHIVAGCSPLAASSGDGQQCSNPWAAMSLLFVHTQFSNPAF